MIMDFIMLNNLEDYAAYLPTICYTFFKNMAHIFQGYATYRRRIWHTFFQEYATYFPRIWHTFFLHLVSNQKKASFSERLFLISFSFFSESSITK